MLQSQVSEVQFPFRGQVAVEAVAFHPLQQTHYILPYSRTLFSNKKSRKSGVTVAAA